MKYENSIKTPYEEELDDFFNDLSELMKSLWMLMKYYIKKIP